MLGSRKCLDSICCPLEPFAVANDFPRHVKAGYRIISGHYGYRYTSHNLAVIATEASWSVLLNL